MTPRGLSLEERFWLHVIALDDESCWLWTGATYKGYGKMFVCREHGVVKTDYAHRISYRIHFGEIPDGYEVDHLCQNHSCVNPWHFELVTGTVNKSRQGFRKTRCRWGHSYTAENTYIDGRGHRRCRACALERRLLAA